MQFNYFHKMIYFRPLKIWRVVRVAEGARLESVYMPKVYREFESLTLRQVSVSNSLKACKSSVYALFYFSSFLKMCQFVYILGFLGGFFFCRRKKETKHQDI